MTKPRDRGFISCYAHDRPTALGPRMRQAIRWPGTASGARLGVLVRSAFGDGCVAFVVILWIDVIVFAVAASAIALAVWRQAPGAQAAAPMATRVAVHSPGYAPARWADRPMPSAGLRVARRGNRTVPASDGG